VSNEVRAIPVKSPRNFGEALTKAAQEILKERDEVRSRAIATPAGQTAAQAHGEAAGLDKALRILEQAYKEA
jgi:hypothetical protein